jgi:hypothetical protein
MGKVRSGEVKSFICPRQRRGGGWGGGQGSEEPVLWEGLKWPLQAGGVGGLFPVGGGGEEQTFLSSLRRVPWVGERVAESMRHSRLGGT